MISVFWIIVVSVLVSWVAVYALVPALRGRVMDIPNARSSHATPTPRGGGVVVVFAVLLALVWVLNTKNLSESFVVILLGALTMALVGLADDFLGGLKVGVRFLIQAVVAVLVVLVAGHLSEFPLPAPVNFALPSWLGWVITLGWILGVTNIYNFLDGIDGFAALQGVIAGTVLGWVLIPGSVGSVLAFAAAGGSLGFLFHNWHPASIFMGDVGSLFLGFLFASLPLAVPRDEVGSAVFAAGMALWFFLSDGTFTIFRRTLHHEKIWEAHCSHLYQRLVQTGWSHAKVTLVVMTAGALVAGLAGWATEVGSVTGQWIAFAVAMFCFLLYNKGVQVLESQQKGVVDGSEGKG